MFGIDPVDENIKTAQHHKAFDPVLDKRIEYKVCSLEEIAEETEDTFDAVIASEVVEHVADLETFIQCCCRVLKVRFMEFISYYSVPISVAKKLLDNIVAVQQAEYGREGTRSQE